MLGLFEALGLTEALGLGLAEALTEEEGKTV